MSVTACDDTRSYSIVCGAVYAILVGNPPPVTYNYVQVDAELSVVSKNAVKSGELAHMSKILVTVAGDMRPMDFLFHP